ncbi:hypothetical protein P9112_003498 [Eukaryota sp. TZLM1-RC]
MQNEFEQKLSQLKSLQEEASSLYSTRTKLLGQLTENEMVLDEFKLLEEDAKIYKLSGPTLLPQDLEESKAMVSSRISYIKNELESLEKKLKEYSDKEKSLTERLQAIQAAAQKHRSNF